MSTLIDITEKTEKIAWQRLNPTQPESLKKTTPARMDKLKKSLIENGFAASFYVFEKQGKIYILDGHHRLKAIQELHDSGVNVPTHFNCTFLNVRDDKHIKKLVLAFNSNYADMTKDGLEDFVSDLNLDDLNQEFEFDLTLEDDEPKEKKLKEPKHCPHCGEEL